MGDLSRKFCDGCKAEFVPATYSQGDESGKVVMKIGVWKETGATVEGLELEVDTACYDKFLAWANAKKVAAASSWSVDIPTPKTFTPPSL